MTEARMGFLHLFLSFLFGLALFHVEVAKSPSCVGTFEIRFFVPRQLFLRFTHIGRQLCEIISIKTHSDTIICLGDEDGMID